MNGKVKLCLGLARLSIAQSRSVHRGPTLNVILPRLAGLKYLTQTDVSLEYHNLKLDEN